MIQPLFSASEMISRQSPLTMAPLCGKCGLYKSCLSPKMKPSGKGRRKILIVGEAPGKTEDQEGIQFVGQAGEYLQEACEEAGLDFRKDCKITDSLICRPPGNKIPNKKMIDYCRPNLLSTIKEFDPDVIIPLGYTAIKSLIGHIWTSDLKNIGCWVGWKIPNKKPNAWIVPNWHPSYLIRNQNDKMLHYFFKKYLKRAVNCKGKPWDVIHDYSSEIKVIDAEQAAHELQKFRWGNRPIAFDYETNCLKPDTSNAKIICCSVSDGKTTIAYPWIGVAIEKTKKLLQSDVPKYGSNIKFEHRWTQKFLGIEVKNWKWDCMLGSHWIDSRPGITSIKFQAYIMLGQPSWNDKVEPFLKAKGGNTTNRIEEISILDLCKYCGMDSLVEWLVAEHQLEIFNASKEY